MKTESTNIDDALIRINQTLIESGEGLSQLSAKLFAIANEAGTDIETVVKGAEELARQGLNRSDMLKRLSDVLVLARLAGLTRF